MSRLIAYMGNDPQRMRCAMHPGRAQFVDAAAGGTAIDGWGVGFYQGGEVLLQRRPKPPELPLDLFEMLHDVKSDALIAHVRRGSYGVPKTENTHPFRFRSWLFAHHGTVAHFDDVREAMLESVPDFLRRNIRGQTDSELLFHMFLAQLQLTGKLDDPTVSTRAVAGAMAQAIAECDRVSRREGEPPSVLDLAATNGRVLAVSRRGRPVHYYRIDGIRDCPVCRETPAEFGRGPRPNDHEHLRAVVIVADGDTSPADPPLGAPWLEVPEGSLITVSRDLEVERIAL